MGQQYRLPDGTIVEAQPDGSFHEIVASSPMSVQTKAADPLLPSKVAAEGYKAQASAYDPARAAAEASQAAAKTPYAGDVARAERDKAVADARKAQIEAQAGGPNPQVAARISDLSNDETLGAIGRARGQIGTFSTGFPGQMLQGIGGTSAKDLSGTLNTVGSRITRDVLSQLKAASATGASGFGALSEREGALLRDSVASLDQGQSGGQLSGNLDQVENHYRRLRAIQAGQNPDDPQVAARFGIPMAATQAPSLGGGDGGGVPPGGTMAPATDHKTIADPALAGVNAHIQALLSHPGHLEPEQITSYLQSVGIPPEQVPDIAKAVAFHNQYSTYKGGYKVNVETKSIPMGALGKAVNWMAQSGPGTGVIKAADALTAGTLDNMTSNPAAARAAMDYGSSQHPGWSLGGTALGSGLGMALGEGALAKAGVTGIKAAMAGDGLYGAAYGAGSSDDSSRLEGAGLGALTGVAGGAIGRGLTKTLGGAVKGVADPALRYLNERGIPLTVGQMAGGAVKSVEDSIAHWPVVGGLVRSQQRAGLKGFQQAAFKDALEPVAGQVSGQIGENGIGQAQQAVSDAYKGALGGVNVQTDPAFKAALPGVRDAVMGIPGKGEEIGAGMSAIANPMFGPGGTLQGTDIQSIMQGMEALKRSYRTGLTAHPLYATHIAPAIDSYTDELTGMLGRQAPEALAGLRAANAANKNVSILGDAVTAARNKGGEFTPATLMNASVASTKRFSGKKAASRGAAPFFDLARNAQQVLPNEVPNSGTAGQLALYGALGGVGGGADYAAGGEKRDGLSSAQKGLALAALLAGGGKAMRPLTQKVLFAPRGAATDGIANFLLKNPQLGGGLGYGLLPGLSGSKP